MKLVLLIGIVIMSLYILSDDKTLFEKIRLKFYKNRSIQLLILLIMFYLIYNDYPLQYTIPLTLFFLFTLYNGSGSTCAPVFSKISNKFKHILEGFKSILDDPNVVGREEEEEQVRIETDVEEQEVEEEDEKDTKRMIDELLDELDKEGSISEYDIMKEAHSE